MLLPVPVRSKPVHSLLLGDFDLLSGEMMNFSALHSPLKLFRLLLVELKPTNAEAPRQSLLKVMVISAPDSTETGLVRVQGRFHRVGPRRITALNSAKLLPQAKLCSAS